MSLTRDELRAQLADQERRLAELELHREEELARLKAIRDQLSRLAPSTTESEDLTLVSQKPTPDKPAEKVKLFRALFRGRADVFPTRFVSKRTGKPGYAPACTNKFVPGVCELPRIKCGECPNQAFVSFSDQAVLDHLQGRQVMGVYPLLPDETCWFLAVDFDKAEWKEDAASFAETSRSLSVPVAVERSRSGNGAHAWFFFAAPVPASVARKMGCYLITETMARRHQLSMGSYDRLFPNQDTMPRGGFGNLIALPLQREARKSGNTVFLDFNLEPYSDQWAYLASLSRMEAAEVEMLAREATRTGRVIGVRLAQPEEDQDLAPWTQPPSAKPRRIRISEPLPSEVRSVLAQRLFVDKAGFPSPLLNEIKRLAAFQNPEFYKRQTMRLSTATTPRVIACSEEFPRHIALPRGCLGELEALLTAYGAALAVDDQRHEGDPANIRFHGELTAVQEQAARALIPHDIGVCVAPPGVGKTVLGTWLVAKRGVSTLVLVHRRPLLDQWIAHLSMFLGVDEKEVGQVGGGKRQANGRLDVAMIQSMVRKGRVDDIVSTYGLVIVDECHHVPTVSFERVLSQVRARYILGLTATPYRRDGHHPILQMQLGPVRFSVDPRSQAAQRPFEHKLIVRETGFRWDEVSTDIAIQKIYEALAKDEPRNRLILDDVISAVAEGRSPILLTERRDHLEFLAARLQSFVRHLVVLHGGMTAADRRDVGARLARVPDSAERLILATGRYIGEGFDDARLDTLFLAMPVSWKGTISQYAGRLHRLHPRKKEVQVFDYVDRDVPLLMRMFEKRLRTYRAIGYARGEAPLGCAEPVEEYTIEYDEEALRHFDDAT